MSQVVYLQRHETFSSACPVRALVKPGKPNRLKDMLRPLGTRVPVEDHDRIHAAALSQGVSVNAFVHTAVMAAVTELEEDGKIDPAPKRFVLGGVRNGPPGYKRRGIEFARWLEKNGRGQLRALREALQVLDADMLRREKFAPVFAWYRKHFRALIDQIPRRRQRLFVEGLLEGLNH